MNLTHIQLKSGFLHMIQGGNDVDGTVSWFLGQYSGVPAVTNAKNAEKSVRNFLTLGGTGKGLALNLLAQRDAIEEYADERTRKAVSVLEANLAALETKTVRYEDRAYETQVHNNDLVLKVESATEKRIQSEHAFLQLQVPLPERNGSEPIAIG